MTSLRQVKLQRARDYILAHPDESKEEQALGSDVSTSLIALARAALVKEGLLRPSRKASPGRPRRSDERSSEGAQPTQPASMLDSSALKAIADMADVDTGDLDDSEVHRRLLKQCIRFAFDPNLHPDTRMSASQMWGKLKDLQKARDLGPGKPLTFEKAVERLRDLMMACGPEITLAAVNSAFDVKEPPHEGTLPDVAPEAPRGAAGPAPAPGSEPRLPTDEGATGPL